MSDSPVAYKILKNKARCRKCGDTLESHSYDPFAYMRCRCGNWIQGGHEFLSRGGPHIEDLQELSSYEGGVTPMSHEPGTNLGEALREAGIGARRQRRYSPEFKQNAVRRALDLGGTDKDIKQVAQELGIGYSTLFYWIPGKRDAMRHRPRKKNRGVAMAENERVEAAVRPEGNAASQRLIQELRAEVAFLRGVVRSLTKGDA